MAFGVRRMMAMIGSHSSARMAFLPAAPAARSRTSPLAAFWSAAASTARRSSAVSAFQRRRRRAHAMPRQATRAMARVAWRRASIGRHGVAVGGAKILKQTEDVKSIAALAHHRCESCTFLIRRARLRGARFGNPIQTARCGDDEALPQRRSERGQSAPADASDMPGCAGCGCGAAISRCGSSGAAQTRPRSSETARAGGVPAYHRPSCAHPSAPSAARRRATASLHPRRCTMATASRRASTSTRGATPIRATPFVTRFPVAARVGAFDPLRGGAPRRRRRMGRRPDLLPRRHEGGARRRVRRRRVVRRRRAGVRPTPSGNERGETLRMTDCCAQEQ